MGIIKVQIRNIFERLLKSLMPVLLGLSLWMLYSYRHLLMHQKDITFLLLVTSLSLTLIIVSFVFKRSITAILFCIIVAIAALTDSIFSLIFLIIFSFSAFLIGTKLRQVLKVKPDYQFIDLLMGFSVYATIVKFSSHFPVNFSGVYTILILSPLFIFSKDAKNLIKEISFKRFESHLNLQNCVLDSIIACILIIYFLVALMPELGYDALSHHLFLSSQLTFLHKWSYDPNLYNWALGPSNGSWLFAYPYMFVGERGTRLLNYEILLITCYAVNAMTTWFGGTIKSAKWAILILLTSPIILLESSSLFTDLIWTVYLVTGVFFIFIKLHKGNEIESTLIILSILFGMALEVKPTSLLMFPLALILIIILNKKTYGKINLSKIFLSLTLFVIMGLTSYIYSWIVTGNPLFPFFNDFFKSSLIPATGFTHPFPPYLSWDIITEITFRSGRFIEGSIGASGFQWLIFFGPFLIYSILSKRFLIIIFSAIAILFWILVFMSTGYLRYVTPSFVIFSVLFGIMLDDKEIFSGIYKKVIFLSGMIIIFLNIVYIKSASHYSEVSIEPLISELNYENYIEARIPIRVAIELVNRLNTSKQPVGLFTQSPLISGLKSPGLIAWWYNDRFARAVNSLNSVDSMGSFLTKENIAYLVLDDNWGSIAQRELITSSSFLIKRFGTISVRQVNGDYLFKTDILGGEFDKTWSIPSDAKSDKSGGIVVSVSKPATKAVKVNASHKYLYTAYAKCYDKKAQGRLQINWLDIKGQFLSTTIQIFDCTNMLEKYETIMTAPEEAYTGIVYAGSHSNDAVVFKSLSLRK